MPDHTETKLLEIKQLGFWRNETCIFKNIDIELGQGELLQIDGANGSGKSTLLRVLAGLLQAESGTIHWQQQDAFADSSDYQQELIYIGHKNAIKDELTPVENLNYIQRLKHKQTGTTAEQALQTFNLGHYTDTPVRQLSAGQKRKVSLARLMLMQTKIWLLDEPFTALDHSGKEILEQIIKQHLQLGGLVLFATHQAIDLHDVPVHSYHLN